MSADAARKEGAVWRKTKSKLTGMKEMPRMALRAAKHSSPPLLRDLARLRSRMGPTLGHRLFFVYLFFDHST